MDYIRFVGFISIFSTAINAISSLSCKSIEAVESIPDNLTYSNPVTTKTTTEALLRLLDLAENEVNIAEFYFNLRPKVLPGDGSEEDGVQVFKKLLSKGLALRKAGGSLKLVVNTPSEQFPSSDAIELYKKGAADLKYINFDELIGAGILHTKLWVVDKKHFYLGSANMDWKSLRQVKEFGLFAQDCQPIGNDFQRLFDVYWYLTTHNIPKLFPTNLQAMYNITNPLKLSSGNIGSLNTFLVSSPPPFCTTYRTTGLNGLLHVIENAKTFIHIEVMEYFPAVIYSSPSYYWPVIDDALRRAMFDRGVEVRLLTSPMPHNETRKDEFHYLQSLSALNGAGHDGKVSALLKLFIVPSFTKEQDRLQFARVNHAKFVITDRHVYISTSNWSGDYFISTGGISMIIENTPSCTLCKEFVKIFERDWHSEYTHDLQSTQSYDDIKQLINFHKRNN